MEDIAAKNLRDAAFAQGAISMEQAGISVNIYVNLYCPQLRSSLWQS